jgi:hypothetical protein
MVISGIRRVHQMYMDQCQYATHYCVFHSIDNVSKVYGKLSFDSCLAPHPRMSRRLGDPECSLLCSFVDSSDFESLSSTFCFGSRPLRIASTGFMVRVFALLVLRFSLYLVSSMFWSSVSLLSLVRLFDVATMIPMLSSVLLSSALSALLVDSVSRPIRFVFLRVLTGKVKYSTASLLPPLVAGLSGSICSSVLLSCNVHPREKQMIHLKEVAHLYHQPMRFVISNDNASLSHENTPPLFLEK